MSINLTVRQIAAIAEFAGLSVDYEKTGFNGDDWDQEFVISENLKVYGCFENGESEYEGMTVHCAEYPEEGFLPLEMVTSDINSHQEVT